jgi:hypothetical protein
MPLDFARTTYFLNGCHESLKIKQAPFLKAPIANFLRRARSIHGLFFAKLGQLRVRKGQTCVWGPGGRV